MVEKFKSTGGIDAANQKLVNVADGDSAQDGVNIRVLEKKNTVQSHSTTRTYELGFIVEYMGQLWKCTTAVSTPGVFNASSWTALAGRENWIRLTASYTAGVMDSLYVDAASAITVTLPATPKSGDYVTIIDGAGLASQCSITVARNGTTINGSAADVILNEDDVRCVFVYLGGTWKTVYTKTDRVKFTGSSAFTAISNVEYLIDVTANFTVTLPVAPKVGDRVRLVDYVGGLGSNTITVNGNGKQINGSANFMFSQKKGDLELAYNGTQWIAILNASNALLANKNLSDLEDPAVARQNLQLGTAAQQTMGTAPSEIRTNTQNETAFQPKDQTLSAIAALVTAADKLIYSTGADTFAQTDLPPQARILLAATTQALQRTQLGLGTAATMNMGNAIGELMQVGAFGLGSFTQVNNAPNSIIVTGFYTIPATAVDAPTPAQNSVMLHYEIAGAVQAGAIQFAIDTNSVLYIRVRTASTWGAWSSITPATSLGTAAYKNFGTAAGNLMEVGAFGLGSVVLPNIGNMDTINRPSGVYRYQNGTDSGTTPNGATWNGIILVETFNANNTRQIAMAVDGTVAPTNIYTRNITNLVTGPWVELLHTGNSAKVPTLPGTDGLAYGMKDGAWSALPIKATTADVIAGTDDVKYLTSKSRAEAAEASRLKFAAFPTETRGDTPYNSMHVLMSDGTITTWGGSNHPMCMGVGESTNTTMPQVKPVFNIQPPEGVTATQIVKAGANVWVLMSNGWVYAAGQNDYGQLGTGDTTARSVLTRIEELVVNGALIKKIVVSGSYRYSNTLATAFFITTAGRVWATGCNAYGQCGDGTATNRTLPGLVGGPGSGSPVVDVFVGGESTTHVLALLESGRIFTWGYNSQGQCGDGTVANVLSPTMRAAFTGGTVVKVAMASGWDGTPTNAYGTTLVLLSNGDVYAAGYNGYSQFGNGTATNSSSFVKVTQLSGIGLRDIGLRGGTFAAGWGITTANELYMWGYNAQYNIGNGTTTTQSTPWKILGYSGDPAGNIVGTPFQGKVSKLIHNPAVWYGGWTMILDTDGQLWFAGADSSYLVSPSVVSNVTRFTPVTMPRLKAGEKFVDVYAMCGGAGSYQFLRFYAITNLGNLWAQGYNESGLVRANGIDTGTSIYNKTFQKIVIDR